MLLFMIRLLLFALLIFAAITACKNENEEDYFGVKKGTDSTSCDTLYVTYEKQIKPMMDYSCVYCHMNEMVVGCDLDNYENTIDYVSRTGNKLYDYVKNNDHQGVILDSCSLKQLSKWVKNPAP